MATLETTWLFFFFWLFYLLFQGKINTRYMFGRKMSEKKKIQNQFYSIHNIEIYIYIYTLSSLSIPFLEVVVYFLIVWFISYELVVLCLKFTFVSLILITKVIKISKLVLLDWISRANWVHLGKTKIFQFYDFQVNKSQKQAWNRLKCVFMLLNILNMRNQ